MRFIAFDLETTGFLPSVNRIVELGLVKFVNGQVDSVFSTLVDPQTPIPKEASQVNGISDDMVKGKPLIESLLNPLAEFCGDDLIVAHNAPFDVQFLTAAIEANQSSSPKGVVIDTLGISRKLLPGLSNYKLGTLVQHFNISGNGFHRAEEDASYCGQVFIKMAEKIAGKPFVMPPLENLIALTGKIRLEFPHIVPTAKQLDFF